MRLTRRDRDLSGISLWMVLTTLVIVAAPAATALRVILGLPAILVFPGYTLIAALYPGADDLQPVERLAFSLGLSIAVVPLLGLALNYLPWGIRLAPIVITLDLFVVALAALAGYRRARLPWGQAFVPPFPPLRERWRSSGVLDRFLGGALVFAIAGLLGAIVYAATSRSGGERFTEFYVLGAGGKAADYPRDLAPGQTAKLILGAVNHEGRTVAYRVTLQLPGMPEAAIASLMLGNGQQWQSPIQFVAPATTGSQRVDILLYKTLDATPYRSLHLTITVGATPTATP